MTNIDRAVDVMRQADRDRVASESRYEVPSGYAQALADAGLLMPTPQIIRSVEELEAFDPDTVMQPPLDELGLWPNAMSARSLKWSMRTWDLKYLPAVVLTPAAQVRAARKALEEA